MSASGKMSDVLVEAIRAACATPGEDGRSINDQVGYDMTDWFKVPSLVDDLYVKLHKDFEKLKLERDACAASRREIIQMWEDVKKERDELKAAAPKVPSSHDTQQLLREIAQLKQQLNGPVVTEEGYKAIRLYPVVDSEGIPWALAREVYDNARKAKELSYTFEGLARTGGFHVSELDRWLPGWRERMGEFKVLKDRADEAEERCKLLSEAGKRLSDEVDRLRTLLDSQPAPERFGCEECDYTGTVIENCGMYHGPADCACVLELKRERRKRRNARWMAFQAWLDGGGDGDEE